MPISNNLPSNRLFQAGVCTSSTRPSAPYEGQVIYETDTDKSFVYNGSVWLQIPILDSSGRLLVPNQVAFQAFGPVVSAANGTNPVILTNVALNIGNGYSASTGRFTAPVSGTYRISWSFLSGNANDVYRWFLRKNNARIGDLQLRADTFATGSEYSINPNREWILSLTTGEYVTIEFVSDFGNQFYNGGGDQYSSFGGNLIG